MTYEELKQEVDTCMGLHRGHVRGLSLKGDTLFPIRERVPDRMGEIEEKLEELGYPFPFSDISSYQWYDASYAPVIYLVCQHLFSWDDQDIKELGRIGTRGSPLLKIAMSFVSMRAAFENSPTLWRKFYDFSEFRPIELTDRVAAQEGKVVFQIHGYDLHRINEHFHCGYFKGITELIEGSEDVESRITRSVFDGDPYTEYVVTWR